MTVLDDPWHRIFLTFLVLVLVTMWAADAVDGWWGRRQNNRSVCVGCGELKPWADFIEGTGRDYCRACGMVICRGCRKVKPVSEYAEGRASRWFCLACGSAVCSSCRLEKPDGEFRDPAFDPTCLSCEVRHLSDHERAALEREEQDYRRRVREGLPVHEPEWREGLARRAALLGVSTRRYTDAEDAVGWYGMVWLPLYLLSAVLVSIYAIVHGVHGGALWEAASPPELLPIPVTILALVGWLLFWVPFTDGGFWRGLELRSGLTDRGALLFLSEAHLLSGLLVPVLIYLLVLIVVPGSWS